MIPSGKSVAIHQPNFFPWLGFFNKLAKADAFVLLDNVQFPKTGGTLINRVKMAVSGKGEWVTVPIVRGFHGVRNINEIEINDETPWRTKMKRTLQMNYARALFFAAVFPFVEELIDFPDKSLCEYNVNAILSIAKKLDFPGTRFVRASALSAEGRATELLISLLKNTGGTTYLCGGGSAGYLEEEKFEKAGLALVYQNFEHPVYPQTGLSAFEPGLSIVDTLMNCGFERTAELLEGEK